MLGGLVSPGNLSLNSMDMCVLERFKWLQQQQQVMAQNNNNSNSSELPQMLQFHGSDGRELKRVGTYFDNNDELQRVIHFPMVGSDFRSNYSMGFASPNDTMDGCISRTNSCQIEPTNSTAVIPKNQEENKGLAMNKRKPEFKLRKESGGKKIKREAEKESSIKGRSNISNTEASISSDTSKEISISKASEIQKPDYIHVRARRGQATDRHSLAERARREKISMKMRYLQDLVPGCDKITGKAGMLDEIINYVQSLQRQVEFLSMKLAVLNPALEFHIDHLSAAKQLQDYIANLPATASKPSEMTSLASFQMNQQGSLDFPVIDPDQTTSQQRSALFKLGNSLTWPLQHIQPWFPVLIMTGYNLTYHLRLDRCNYIFVSLK